MSYWRVATALTAAARLVLCILMTYVKALLMMQSRLLMATALMMRRPVPSVSGPVYSRVKRSPWRWKGSGLTPLICSK